MSSTHSRPASSTGDGFFASRGLVRTPYDRKVAGVCACLARVSGFDPLLWRVLFSVFVLFNGVGVALYVLCWLFIPSRYSSSTKRVVLAALGALFLFSVLFWTDLWGCLVFGAIGGGLLALAQHQGTANFTPSAVYATTGPAPASSGPFRERTTSLSEDADLARFDTATMPAAAYPSASDGGTVTVPVSEVTDMPPGQTAQHAEVTDMPSDTRPEPAGSSSRSEAAPDAPPASGARDASDVDPQSARTERSPLADDTTPPVDAQRFATSPARSPQRGDEKVSTKPQRKRSRGLAAVTLSLVAVAMSIMLIVSMAGANVPFGAFVGVALIMCGCGLVVGTWVGRSTLLYVTSAVLAAVMAANIAVGGAGVTGFPLGSSYRKPATAAHVSESVEATLTSVELDLREVPIDPDSGVSFETYVTGGALTVYVPADVTVIVHPRERMAANVRVEGVSSTQGNYIISSGSDLSGEVVIEAYLTAGSLEVVRG